MLTIENICFMHNEIINNTGGEKGIHDIGLLESAINNINQTFDGKELYPTVFDKASQLFYSLVKNHAFNDGNKRTAVWVLQFYLNLNNQKLLVTDKELTKLALDTAMSNYTVQNIKDWLKVHIGLKFETPNETTVKAIEEADEMVKNGCGGYDSLNNLLNDFVEH